MIPNKTQESQGGQRRIFFAEKVLDKRGRGRKAEYLIKWLAREEKATWERRENCWLPTMISNFEEERKLAARNKKEKKRLAKNVKIQTNSRYNGRVAYVGRGAGKRVLVQFTNGQYFAPNPVSGFERGLVPEKVCESMINNRSELMFQIKWKDVPMHPLDIVYADEAHKRCPQLVIAFYEERLTFSDDDLPAGVVFTKIMHR